MDDKNNQIIHFGLTSFRAQKKKFGIKKDDRRRHFYTIGKTGMGKSNLMENMAIQDIQLGNGMAYVDPHGEGAEKLLDFIPENRIKDVIFFNPADLDFPIAFNIMEKVDFRYRHLVAGGLMGVFKKVWPDVWSARMEYILNNSILALLEYPDSTLLGVNRMLAEPDYRAEVVSKITDPIVRAFWVTEYARYTQRYEIEATAAIQNKVGQFVSNALIRNIIGQTKSTINMRQIMDEEKILILDLSKGRIGEDNSRLLGALLITKIQLAAMSRVDIPEPERKDFYLYVDEFQNFATESFANILSEARKYRLNLIVGHQYITQMDEIVRDAVFGNVGTMAVFRIGAEDADFLEKEFTPEFLAEDLVNSTKYNIYLKLMIDGISSRPFSAQTLPPPIPLEHSNRDKIIEASRATYGIAREIVEENISSWTTTVYSKESRVAPKSAALPSASGSTNPRPIQAFAAPASSPQENQQTLYDAICDNCGKPTKVIFQPEEGRKVYCKSCLKKMKAKKDADVQSKKPQAQPLGKAQGKDSFFSKVIGLTKPEPAAPPKEARKEPPRMAEVKEDRKDEKPRPSTPIENISFSASRRRFDNRKNPSTLFRAGTSGAKPQKKEINLSELKKALDESLKEREEVPEKATAKGGVPSEGGKKLPIEKKVESLPTDEKEKNGNKGVIKPGEKINL